MFWNLCTFISSFVDELEIGDLGQLVALIKSRLKVLSSIVSVLRVRRIHSFIAVFVAQ